MEELGMVAADGRTKANHNFKFRAIGAVTAQLHQCRIKVARGPWHILSAGPLRRGLSTFASSTDARETGGGGGEIN